MNSTLKKLWPLFFLFFFWLSFAYPYFFLNKVPFPATHLVNAFSPWSRYSEYASPIKNNAMPDVIDQIYPWKYFSIEQLKQGNLPFWNPYAFSGTPHIANYQSAVFSPFTLLYFFLPFIDAWSVIILLQPLLAGIGTYLYMRKVGVSQIGSLIASVSFMFSGFMVVWMAYGTLSMAMAMLPFILYFTELVFSKKETKYLIGISIPLAVSFLSGHFQTSFYLAIVAFLYIIFKAYTTKRYRWGIVAGAGYVIGILLTLPQVIPSLEFYQNAVRSSSFSLSGGIPFYNLVTIFAPDFFGNPVTRNNIFLDFAEWQAFIGSGAFLLSVCALSFSKKTPLQLFFGGIGLCALLLAVASPLQAVVAQLHIPVISTSAQSRIIILFSFCFALLAGFGFDTLQTWIQEKKYKTLFVRLSAVLVIIFLIWGVLFVGNYLSPEQTQIAKKNFILPSVFIIAISGSILLSVFLKNKYVMLGLQIMLLVLVSFESYRYATKWVPFDPRELVFPKESITTEINKHIGAGRIYGNLGQQMSVYYGLQTVEGYDPLYIQRYGEFITSSVDGSFAPTGGRTAFINKTSVHSDRALNILGVNLIFHPVADTNAVWAYPVWEKKHMKQIASDGIYSLFRNQAALPKTMLFYDIESQSKKEAIVKRLYDEKFDYKKTLLLEEKSPIVRGENIKHSAHITSYSPNSIEIAASTPQTGMLFLSDAYYPGWKAYIDGKETKIYRANYAFRAIVLPAGKHTVVFDYFPMSFVIGVIGAGIGLLSLLLIVFMPQKKLKSFQR